MSPSSPDRVDRDFTLEVEVYCSVPTEEMPSKPSTPIKMLKKFRSRVSGLPSKTNSSMLNFMVHVARPFFDDGIA